MGRNLAGDTMGILCHILKPSLYVARRLFKCYLAQSTKDALLRSQKVNYKQAKSSLKHEG